MKTITQCHIRAIKELVEMISIGGVVAIVADLCWIAHDIAVSEIARPGLWAVGAGLLTAFFISGYGLYHYHVGSVKALLHDRLLHKLHVNKAKQHHRREHDVRKA